VVAIKIKQNEIKLTKTVLQIFCFIAAVATGKIKLF